MDHQTKEYGKKLKKESGLYINNVKNVIISNGDIIHNVEVISDVYYKEIGKTKKKRRYFQIKCLKCGEISEAREIALKHKQTGHCLHCRSNIGRMKGNPKNYNKYEFYNDLYAPFYNIEYGNYDFILNKINKAILNEFSKLKITRKRDMKNEN